MYSEEIAEIEKKVEEQCGEDNMNGIKAEVAWILGLDEGSDEWEELMEV